MDNNLNFKLNQIRLYFYLFLGIVWLILFASYIFLLDSINYISIFYLFLGLCYSSLFIVYYFFPYIKIENNYLIIRNPFVRKLNLTQILKLKYFAGDYIFETSKGKVVIFKNNIKKTQRQQFEHFFQRLASNLTQKQVIH